MVSVVMDAAGSTAITYQTPASFCQENKSLISERSCNSDKRFPAALRVQSGLDYGWLTSW